MESPLGILREAQRQVPALRYALGVAGVAAAVAIVAGFKLDPRIAVFGTIIMFGLMFVLVVFSVAAATAGSSLVILALVAAWAFVMLTIATSTLLMTSYFFLWPRSLLSYLPSPTPINDDKFTQEVRKIIKGEKAGDQICRSDPNPSPVQPFERGWLLYRPSKNLLYAVVRIGGTEIRWRMKRDTSTSQNQPCPDAKDEDLLQWGFRDWYCSDAALKSERGRPIFGEDIAWVQYQEWTGGLLVASLPWRSASFKKPEDVKEAEYGRYFEMDVVFLEQNSDRSSFVPFTYGSFEGSAWCTSLWWSAYRTVRNDDYKKLVSQQKDCENFISPSRYKVGGNECSLSGR